MSMWWPRSLAKHGFDAAPIHGDLDQSLRTKTLDRFRAGELKILVASDVAARGLDVPAVSHVFNFDVPIHADDYVHRIGRTGRAGRSGAGLSCWPRPATANMSRSSRSSPATSWRAAQMMDIEVREDRAPAPRRRAWRRTRPRTRGGRDGKHRDRRPPGGKFHDQVAAMEPVREAPVEASLRRSRPFRTRRRTEQHRDQKRHEQPRPEQAAAGAQAASGRKARTTSRAAQ